MARDQIVVEAWVTVPVDKAWTAYTAPAQVTHRSRTGHARVTHGSRNGTLHQTTGIAPMRALI
jgi:hypothetical protein